MQVLSRSLTRCALAAACLLGMAAAGAATPPATTPGAQPVSAPAHARQRLDANGDGQVSRAEYQAWIDARFARIDTNGDGVVSVGEIIDSPAARQRAERRARRFVERFAAPGSSQVSRSDFETALMVRFDRVADGGDTVSLDQLRPDHPRGPRKHDAPGH
ncbi:hypothetical protein [Dokdonella sp.]|uniref:hypothetical protein n=1 Tax=Dokdonella sp. TaxID=2291710 RepID=UPI0025C6E7CF|nr:hypothetical protein [Dokdonella sp.]MBX3687786.1 hypothetical protein [Dokdonella sp.]